MNKASRKEIESFLNKVKELVKIGNYVFLDNRKKNKEFLDSGNTYDDLERELLSLNTSNYIDGPLLDDDYLNAGGLVWIFNKLIKGIKYYIKMKIEKQEQEWLIILSFHIAKY